MQGLKGLVEEWKDDLENGLCETPLDLGAKDQLSECIEQLETRRQEYESKLKAAKKDAYNDFDYSYNQGLGKALELLGDSVGEKKL